MNLPSFVPVVFETLHCQLQEYLNENVDAYLMHRRQVENKTYPMEWAYRQLEEYIISNWYIEREEAGMKPWKRCKPFRERCVSCLKAFPPYNESKNI